MIFVDQKYPFGFYYERYAIDPSATPTGSEAALARYLFVDINTIDQRLTEWPGSGTRLFGVQWFESDTDPRGRGPLLAGQVWHARRRRNFPGLPAQLVGSDSAHPLRPGRWLCGPIPRLPRAGDFGQVWTESISLPSTPVTPGRPVDGVIRWRAVAGDLTRSIKVRLGLYDDAGNRLGQDDRLLLNDRHLAPSQWGEADRPLNVYAIPTPGELAPGAYDVRLLVYDADTFGPLWSCWTPWATRRGRKFLSVRSRLEGHHE